MRVVVFQEKKLRERKRESYKFINSYESIQHIYPSNTNKYVKDATRKKKCGCKRDFKERSLVNIYINFEILIIDFQLE